MRRGRGRGRPNQGVVEVEEDEEEEEYGIDSLLKVGKEKALLLYTRVFLFLSFII